MTGAILSLLVGSGFATGQETLQFFAVHGQSGLLGIALAYLIGIYLSVSLLLAGKEHRFADLQSLFEHFVGGALGRVSAAIATVLLFLSLSLMLSAAGSIGVAATGFPAIFGSSAMAVAVTLVVLLGLERLIQILAICSPFLIGLIAAICISALVQNHGFVRWPDLASEPQDLLRATSWWVSSSFLYIALQGLAVFCVLPTFVRENLETRDLVFAGIHSVSLFCAMLTLVTLALWSAWPSTAMSAIPLYTLALMTVPWLAGAFSVVVTIGVFTTACPLHFAVFSRFHCKTEVHRILVAMTISTVAVAAAQTLPFEKLANILLPAFGLTGAALLLFIPLRQIRTRSWAR